MMGYCEYKNQYISAYEQTSVICTMINIAYATISYYPKTELDLID